MVQGECKDKREDCKELATQPGYCDFYQQDMANLCPASCNFCGKLIYNVLSISFCFQFFPTTQLFTGQ